MQEFEAPKFQDNQHMNVVTMSTMSKGHLYHPMQYSWYSFLLEGESTTGPKCGREVYVKISNDNIWNQTRELLACSAVSQLTASPCDPSCLMFLLIIFLKMSCKYIYTTQWNINKLFILLTGFIHGCYRWRNWHWHARRKVAVSIPVGVSGDFL